MSASRELLWFQDISHDDEPIVGKSAMIMAKVRHMQVNIPQGFIVTAEAFHRFLQETKLDLNIEGVLLARQSDNREELDEIGNRIKAMILNTEIPTDLSHAIMMSYLHLAAQTHNDGVAIKTSLASAFTSDAMYLTATQPFLNVIGEANVAMHIRQSWANFFDGRWLAKRIMAKRDHKRWGLAVMVEQMLRPEVSGIILSSDLVHKQKQTLIIEALLGDHTLVDFKAVTPDRYLVNKQTGDIQKHIHIQEQQVVRHAETIEPRWEAIPERDQEKSKLTDEEIAYLGEIGRKLEHNMIQPLEIEWAKEQSQIYILNVQPYILKVPSQPPKPPILNLNQEKLSTSPLDLPIAAQGEGVTRGLITGYVKHITSQADIDRLLPSEIAVVTETNSAHVDMLKRCAGVVTEAGGLTSHAALVCQAIGKPCIIGVTDALQAIKNGKVYTMDAKGGYIYQGGVKKKLGYHEVQEEVKIPQPPTEGLPKVVTATKIYLHLDQTADIPPDLFENVDGVIVNPRKFMHKMPAHPRYLIENKLHSQFQELLHEELDELCEEMNPEPVIYQLSDWSHEEYKELRYGLQFESIHAQRPNQGLKRLLEERDLLDMELEAVKYVRNKNGRRNIWLMLSHVVDPEDIVEVKRHMATLGLSRSGQLKLYLRVEFPYQLIDFEKFAVDQVDGVMFDISRLWHAFTGLPIHATPHLFPDEEQTQFWNLVSQTIKLAHKHKIDTILQAVDTPQIAILHTAITAGIQGVSTQLDNLKMTVESVINAESDLLKNRQISAHIGPQHHRYKPTSSI